MRIVVTGGQGFIGRTLARHIVSRRTFRGEPVDDLVLADLAPPATTELDGLATVRTVTGDLAATLPELFADPVDVVVHLASAVSSECERDFDLGMRSNLLGTHSLLEAARAQTSAGASPATLVFSSSVAVYGPDPAMPLPPVVSEATLATPQSSYGAQKLAAETLIADYTRKGFVDGRVVRLMTVAIRPGIPTAAASSFVSGIIREPLAGVEATCPVSPDLALAISSPRRTVEGILTVAEVSRGLGSGELSGRLPVNLPALTVRVHDMLAALRRVAGDAVAARVRIQPDPAIEAIVASWPARFDSARVAALGLTPDPDIDSVIQQYLDEHPEALGGL
ncbi:MAG: D-erythronate dehydrogenase [Dermatophilaceae bacterium]